MSCYVDPLINHGWRLRGKIVPSCHLFTDGDLKELHEFAGRLGLDREFFQLSESMKIPHYDLVFSLRKRAIEFGAIPVDCRRAVEIWKAYREKGSG